MTELYEDEVPTMEKKRDAVFSLEPKNAARVVCIALCSRKQELKLGRAHDCVKECVEDMRGIEGDKEKCESELFRVFWVFFFYFFKIAC